MAGEHPHAAGAEPGVEDANGHLGHAALSADVLGLRPRVPRGASVAVRSRRAALVAGAVTALDGWAERVALVGPHLDVELPPDTVVLDDSTSPSGEAPATADDAEPAASTRWLMYTSGTTGTPKAVEHTLGSLSRTVRPPRAGASRRWGLLYEPTRMAGVQVVLQAVLGGEHLLDPGHLPHLRDRVRWLADRGADAVSATPTMWRQILQMPDSKDLPLRQITLGGEIADQLVLDALARSFPAARITHVFAATETGAAFAVHDGREGFPLSYLDDAPGGIRLDVRDGVLHVHAPDVDIADHDGFVPTGDIVEVDGDRVRFLGRNSGVANVGGVKVWPERVEAVLRSHAEVADAVVTTRKNPFSGSILAAEVVAADDADSTTLPKRLRAHCAEQLESAAVPAVVKVVDELRMTDSGKAGRR